MAQDEGIVNKLDKKLKEMDDHLGNLYHLKIYLPMEEKIRCIQKQWRRN